MNSDNTSSSSSSSSSNPSRWRQLLVLVPAVLVVGSVLVATNGGLKDAIISSIKHNNPTQEKPVLTRRLGEDCETQCKEADSKFKDLEYFGGKELLKPTAMLEQLQQKRKDWVNNRLKVDYGADYYQDIFEPLMDVLDPITNITTNQRVSVGRNLIFKDPSMAHIAKNKADEVATEGPAWGRMVRKFQMKLLEVRLNIIEERINAKPICLEECAASEQEGSRRTRRNLKFEPSNGLYSKFTWATGGHSASAGHGNMFRESYTANMDRVLTPIMQQIGLDFVAKNYAMGGTDCAEEVALCLNSIFGRDMDAISWDYGMTDGHDLYKMTMYAYKAAGISKITDHPGSMTQHRPAFFAIHQNTGHNLVVKAMQDVGMTTLAWDGGFMAESVMAAVPDMLGKNDAEIAKVAPNIQYLKCGEQVEKGDPGCDTNKWNDTLCTGRRFRTSWHPGWKYHALVGNLMALTLLDVTEDALQGLIEVETEMGESISEAETLDATKKRLQDQLQMLDKAEKADYDQIFSSPIPEALIPHLDVWWNGEKKDHLEDLDIEPFLKGSSFCHAALLPSEIRLQGFLTENLTTAGTILDNHCDETNNFEEIKGLENPNPRHNIEGVEYKDPRPEKDGQMMLAAADQRQVCEEDLNLDFKDAFIITSVEGWRSLTLPNEAEKKHYTEFVAAKSKGIVLACLSKCDWGNCKEGDFNSWFGWERPKPKKDQAPLTEAEVKKFGTLEMTINGVPVTEKSNMHTCFALKHKDGHVWKPNANGQYEIKARLSESEKYAYLKFSSFILV